MWIWMYNPDIPDSRGRVQERSFQQVWKERGWLREETPTPVAVASVPGPLGSEPPVPDPLSREGLNALSVKLVKDEARSRGLRLGGKKEDIITRIRVDAGVEVLDD